jgi:energy-coupling factor transport system substrate-specific component
MVVLTAVSAALYVALLIPFKFLPMIPGITELRPAAAIPPVCSLLFGPAGAFGAAFGNLIGDFFGTLGPGSFFGFFGNFLYGYIPYKVVRALANEDYNWKMPARNWIALELAIALGACSCAITVGFGLDMVGLAPFKIVANLISFNNLIFGLTLGPVILLSVFPYIKDSGLFFRELIPQEPPNRMRKILSIVGVILILAGVISALALGNFQSVIQQHLALSGKALIAASTGPGLIFIILGAIII